MNRIIDLKKLKDEQNTPISERPQAFTRPADAGRSKSHQFFDRRSDRQSESNTAPAATTEISEISSQAEVAKKPVTGQILEWRVFDSPKVENLRDRIVIISILATGFIIGGLITHNYMFAILALLVAIILIVYAVREPKEITFTILGRGVRVGPHLYEFENLKSFWIFYDPPHLKELSIESKKIFMPFIKIPIEDLDPVEIRRMLRPFIPEKKHEEALSDVIGHWFGL